MQYERRAEALGNTGGRNPLVRRNKYKLSNPFPISTSSVALI